MAWQKKATAPEYFNLTQQFLAAITGDTNWEWLARWTPLVGDHIIDTELFCAAGPREHQELNLSTLLSWPAGTGIETGTQIERLMYERMFSAYCEYNTGQSAPSWLPFYENHKAITADWWFDPAAGATIPTGATKIRVKYEAGSFQAGDIYFNPGTGQQRHAGTYNNSNQWQEFTVTQGDLTVGVQGRWHSDNWGGIVGNYTSNIYFEAWVDQLVTEPQPLEDTPPPAGLPQPVAGVYPDLAALGAELDRQELKLDGLINMVRYLGTKLFPKPEVLDDPITVTDETEVEVGDAVGVVVTLTALPPDADVSFGTPPRLARVGYVALGTIRGWLPPIEIAYSPLHITPIPDGVTTVHVNIHPPHTATVELLRPEPDRLVGPP